MYSQDGARQSQRNIIRKLIIVTVVFAVCWGPNQVYFLLVQLGYNVGPTFYWWTVIFAFLNVFINPFVYPSKLEAVRKKVNAWLRIESRGQGKVGPVTPATKLTLTIVPPARQAGKRFIILEIFSKIIL